MKRSSGTHKRKCSINRQNKFPFTEFKLVYILIRKTLKCNSLVVKHCVFLQKKTSHFKRILLLNSQGTKQYIFGDYFYSNNVRKLRFCVILLFHVRKLDIIILPEVN